MIELDAGFGHLVPPTAPVSSRHPTCGRGPRMAAHILDTLYRLERAGVLAYLTREVGPEHASDLAQEVFVRAASSTQLNQLRNPGGFLRCIARNLVVDFTRRRRCRIATLPLAQDCDAPSRPEQEDRLHAAEVERAYEQA